MAHHIGNEWYFYDGSGYTRRRHLGSGRCGSAVVVSRLDDDKIVGLDEVDEAVLLVDPSRPAALEHVAELLRFADTARRLAQRCLNKPIDAPQRGAVGRLPMPVILPGDWRKDEPQSASSCSSRFSSRARSNSRAAVGHSPGHGEGTRFQ